LSLLIPAKLLNPISIPGFLLFQNNESRNVPGFAKTILRGYILGAPLRRKMSQVLYERLSELDIAGMLKKPYISRKMSQVLYERLSELDIAGMLKKPYISNIV
jgi:hypothetical protein